MITLSGLKTLTKSDFSCPRNYYMKLAPQLGLGHPSHPYLWLHAGILIVWNLYTLSQSPWVLMCNWPVVSRKHYFLLVIHHLALTTFLLHLSQTLGIGGIEYDINILYRVEYSEVSYSLHIGQLWVFVLIAICFKKDLLWWELRGALIYGYSNESFYKSF